MLANQHCSIGLLGYIWIYSFTWLDGPFMVVTSHCLNFYDGHDPDACEMWSVVTFFLFIYYYALTGKQGHCSR